MNSSEIFSIGEDKKVYLRKTLTSPWELVDSGAGE